jgi:hypothetical protein
LWGLLIASAGVSRILCPTRGLGDDHLSRPDIAERALAAYLGLAGGQPTPCLALLPVGFTEPPRSPGALVVSYTTVSPLPVRVCRSC